MALSIDELRSAGNEALVRAALRYDPASPASFSTYAHYRVRGAMIDAIRKRSPGLRTRARALIRLEATQALLEQASEDQAARQRHADKVQTLEQRVQSAREIVRRAALVMRMASPHNDELDRATDEEGEDPEQLLFAADRRAQLWTWIDALSEPDRALVQAVYVRGLSMQEYADEIGVSGATISRRHARIVAGLSAQAQALDQPG